jgi:MerR family redox-sensitive transcriptional activator SoxR
MADYSVGFIAKRADIAVSTLHFYESKGLIQSRRNAGNQRRYSKTVLRRIAVIKMAQTLGYSLQEISSMLDVLGDGQVDKKNWSKLSKRWKKDLDRRIAQMQLLRDELTQCIGCGCLSLNDCRLRNPDDALAEQGNGAVLWQEDD